MNAAREGYSTGTCAAAAAKAAVLVLSGRAAPQAADVRLPDGTQARLPVLYARRTPDGRESASAEAAVRKDAGDDPDVTHATTVVARVDWTAGGEILFAAGEGVGTVTRPGLSVPPGEPAINPVPREMIRQAIRDVTDRAVQVTISIPGGRKLAEKTFNPRLGIVGGLSILGTTGRVRPFSHPALQAALKCGVEVAVASGTTCPVLVPGHIGERAAHTHFELRPEQVLAVSNEWGFMLDLVAQAPFTHALALGHPGKLGKLAAAAWDTHSSRSGSAVAVVAKLGATVLGRELPEMPTVEGLFASLPGDERTRLADALATQVRRQIAAFLQAAAGAGPKDAAVVLVNMRGEWLGTNGDLGPWRRRS
ncbi:MAG: cobalt-precorrin-5B (C(1))-methyltransferase CbiD [Planctomycetota bacterium]|nr:cobalt-precorrin-5B (C(1))-methyltransferase CbiD [Planctomycetota bacterium]